MRKLAYVVAIAIVFIGIGYVRAADGTLTLKITPQTLNLKSQGIPVKAHISGVTFGEMTLDEFVEAVSSVAITSVNGELLDNPIAGTVDGYDVEDDTVTVTFSRAEVIDAIGEIGPDSFSVTLTVTATVGTPDDGNGGGGPIDIEPDEPVPATVGDLPGIIVSASSGFLLLTVAVESLDPYHTDVYLWEYKGSSTNLEAAYNFFTVEKLLAPETDVTISATTLIVAQITVAGLPQGDGEEIVELVGEGTITAIERGN